MTVEPLGKPFEPGRAKTGGRGKGTRNKLQSDFIAALSKAFDERGDEAIRVVIDENPKDFLRVIAAILPKELEINDNRLKEITDDQLDAFIEFARGYIGGALADGSGENKAADGESACLLQAISKTD